VIATEPLPEEKAREVVYQILDGVKHLHILNIVHLDLKVRRE
jgi:serine/threonine protein kinase